MIKFFFTFLTHIIECLIIIPMNRWIHCNAYKHPGCQCSWLYFISAHAITSTISQTKLNYKMQVPELNIAAVPTANSVHLSNLDIVWHFGRLREMFNMMDRKSLIACQTSHSLSTASLECFLECLRHLESTLQYSHCHWIVNTVYRSTWTMCRGHSPALAPRCSAVYRVVPGSLKICNFILHYVSPFYTIFFHYTTSDFGIDKYK